MLLSTKITFLEFRNPALDFLNTKLFESVFTPYNNMWFEKMWIFDVASH